MPLRHIVSARRAHENRTVRRGGAESLRRRRFEDIPQIFDHRVLANVALCVVLEVALTPPHRLYALLARFHVSSEPTIRALTFCISAARNHAFCRCC